MNIQFGTNSAAFCGNNGEQNFWDRTNEIARILRKITRRIESGYDHGAIMDMNGNKVGTWSL